MPPACIGASDFGLLIVSSTDMIIQAASDAAVSALMRIIDGSHTQASKLSAMSSCMTSTPNQQLPRMKIGDQLKGSTDGTK